MIFGGILVIKLILLKIKGIMVDLLQLVSAEAYTLWFH